MAEIDVDQFCVGFGGQHIPVGPVGFSFEGLLPNNEEKLRGIQLLIGSQRSHIRVF